METKPVSKLQKQKFFNENERIWGVLFLIFFIISLCLFQNVYEFFTNPIYKNMINVSFSDLQIIIPIAIITWIYRDLFMYFFASKLAKHIDPISHPTEEERAERALYLCKFILDVLYYSFSSITTYYILKDSNFLPVAMLGKGDIANAISEKFPSIDILPHMKTMYCVQLGFHLYSFCHQLIMKRSDKKYLEFVLHHSLTIFLILYSYATNFINLGSLTLIMHDCSDALLSLTRGYSYLKNKSTFVIALMYFSGVSLWIYTRLYVFPVYAIWPCYRQLVIMDEKHKPLFSILIMFYLCMLSTLLIMHIYWTITLVKALIDFLTKKKIRTDYNVRIKKF